MRQNRSGGVRVGWPWALEILALVLALGVLALPPLFPTVESAAAKKAPLVEQQSDDVQKLHTTIEGTKADALWTIGVLAIYGLHLWFGIRDHRLISTPLTHVLTPLVFTAMLYLRLTRRTLNVDIAEPILQLSVLPILFCLAGVAALAIVMARMRMARSLLGFRQSEAAISRGAVRDKTYWSLAPFITPVIYRPVAYHTFAEALVIQGWLYLTVLPLENVTSVERVAKEANLPNGTFLATSRNALVRIRTNDFSQPIFISPDEADVFARYAATQVAERRKRQSASRARSASA